MDILQKLDGCFNRLQTLDIKATLFNMEKLVQTLYDLREVYTEIERMGINGTAAHTEGQNNH